VNDVADGSVDVRGEWKALLGWTLVAFLLRFFLLVRFDHVISPDGVYYVELGRSLIAGNLSEGLSIYWPPLYPLLIGLSSLVFGDPEFGGRFVSAVAGGLLVVPACLLTRIWYGRRVALICAGVVALHPVLVYYSTVLLTEATYTLLFTCGVLAGWAALSGGRGRAYLLTGATFGACYLLRPEAAGFILLLLIPTLGAKLFDRHLSLKTSARNALLLCAGFLLLALPYLLYLRQNTGAWTLSGKLAGHLWQGARRAGDAMPPAGTLVPGLTTAVVQITKALRHEYEVLNLIFPPPFVVLAGLGLFGTGWSKPRARRELYLFSFVAAAIAGYAVTLANIRFLVPLLPILLCWLAKGLVEFEDWAGATAERLGVAKRLPPRVEKLFVPLLAAGLLAILLPLSIYLMRGDKWGDYHGQKRAGLWIKGRAATSDVPVVMSTVPITAFYAGGRHVFLVEETPAALVERMRRERVDYLIINEREVKHMNLLRPLLDERGVHPGLRLFHSLAEAPGHKIVVYAPENGASP
jgi:4-amino-4-deoxy-L-arabinose transferase-like glycosyltransferase